MAAETEIAWCKSTFNPWIGCTKVSPGCDACYAEVRDRRHKWGGATHWGPGVPRYRTSPGNWDQVRRWNRQAPDSEFAGRRGFWPVFCASLGDVFDNEVDRLWRYDLWRLIEATPNLSWLLLTKRIGNVIGMIPVNWEERFPGNVRLMISVVNQEEADRDIPKLLALPCHNGISYEPALGPIDFGHWADPRYLGWIIVGGESSQGPVPGRPFVLQWARDVVVAGANAGVPVFVKQLGSWWASDDDSGERAPFKLDRAGADPSEWPDDLRVQEFPL